MEENNKKNVVSKDLIPITLANKNTGMLGYFNIWIGIAIVIATFAVGGEAAHQLNLQQIIIAAILGTLLLGILFSITSDIGTEHGIAFPIYVGTILGIRGTALPNLLRTLYGPIWFGIQSYFGATAINQIVLVFTGFDNWKPWFVVFVAVQIINAALGFKAMEKLANVAAPTIIVIGIYMTYKLMSIAAETGVQVWSTVYQSSSPSLSFGGVAAFFAVTILNMNYWADNACEVETWSRYVKTYPNEKNSWKRNRNATIAYLVALPLASSFMVFLGALSTYVTGNYNPIEAINSMTNNPFLLSVLLIMIILAQWSTNSVCNLMPSGMCIVALFRSKIPYWLGIVICGLIGVISQPWLILDNITLFLITVGSLWSTIYGMTIADYFLLRKRKLNVPDLYKSSGESQYAYANGFNPAGFLGFIIGLVGCVLLPDYAFITGVIVAGTSYYFIAKYWVFKKYPQSELGPENEKCRGISVGREWLYDEQKNIVYPSK